VEQIGLQRIRARAPQGVGSVETEVFQQVGRQHSGKGLGGILAWIRRPAEKVAALLELARRPPSWETDRARSLLCGARSPRRTSEFVALGVDIFRSWSLKSPSVLLIDVPRHAGRRPAIPCSCLWQRGRPTSARLPEDGSRSSGWLAISLRSPAMLLPNTTAPPPRHATSGLPDRGWSTACSARPATHPVRTVPPRSDRHSRWRG
jgi:hypothetical protein